MRAADRSLRARHSREHSTPCKFWRAYFHCGWGKHLVCARHGGGVANLTHLKSQTSAVYNLEFWGLANRDYNLCGFIKSRVEVCPPGGRWASLLFNTLKSVANWPPKLILTILCYAR